MITGNFKRIDYFINEINGMPPVSICPMHKLFESFQKRIV